MEKLYLWSTYLYSWCTSLGEKLTSGNDFVNYYQDYFRYTSVCINVFIAGFVSALVIAAIFYFIICNKSYVLAKRYFWAITVVVTFLTTFGISHRLIMGYEGDPGYEAETSSGMFYYSYQTGERLKESKRGNPEEIKKVDTVANEYRESLRSAKELLPMEMAGANGVYSMFFYLLFSLLFKKHTVHGKAIPW